MSDPLRFFVPPESLHDDQVTIGGDTHHHLHNVLRTRPGSTLTLLDGQGLCCEVELQTINKHEATARVLRRWQDEERALPITLLQAVPKGDKFDLILQKGTELGVRCFQPVKTAHAVPQVDSARMTRREQRWVRIATEAARQCRRSVLPRVNPVQPLAEVITEQSDDLRIVLWEAGSVPLADVLPEEKPSGVRLLVGPEGGFSAEELNKISAAGFRAAHLGPRVLRTETAGLAATAILQYLYGDCHQSPAGNEPDPLEEKP
jgi:16S rRNA (uracil1498-N3)-methyltransferase